MAPQRVNWIDSPFCSSPHGVRLIERQNADAPVAIVNATIAAATLFLKVVATRNRRTEGMGSFDLSDGFPAKPRPQIGPGERPCMLIKPCLREHPGWEFGNNCSAG